LEFIAWSSSSEPLGLLSATTTVALSRFVDVAMLSVEVLVAKSFEVDKDAKQIRSKGGILPTANATSPSSSCEHVAIWLRTLAV
jgi:hypothetical protein